MKRSSKNTIMTIVGALLLLSAAGLLLFTRYSGRISEEKSSEYLSEFDEIVYGEKAALDGMSGDMPVLSIDGIDMIGKIAVPSYGVSIPVMNESINGAVFRIVGSLYDGDLTVVGSSKDLLYCAQQITTGDELDFTDVQGNTYILEAERISHSTGLPENETFDCDLTLIVKNELDMSYIVICCNES